MTGLDTSLLMRLLTGDDEVQQRRVRRWIDQNCSPQVPVFINRIVVVEVEWVLRTAYKYPRQAIANVIDGLLRAAEFALEDAAHVRQALDSYRSGGDFADALVAAVNAAAGCPRTLTFDIEAAKRSAHFQLLRS